MTLQINHEAKLPIFEIAKEWGIPHQEIIRFGSLSKITLLTSYPTLTLLEIPVPGKSKNNMIRKMQDNGIATLEADRLINLAIRELNKNVSSIEILKIFTFLQLSNQAVALQPNDLATLLSHDTVTLHRVLSPDRKNTYQILSLNHNQLFLTINHKEAGLTIGYSDLFINPDEKDRFERDHIINRKLSLLRLLKNRTLMQALNNQTFMLRNLLKSHDKIRNLH